MLYKCDTCAQTIQSRQKVSEIGCACGGLMTSTGEVQRVTMRAVGRFALAVTKWMAAGRPTRTHEQIETLLRTHCGPCPQYVDDTCKLCACPVTIAVEPLKNKLAMATERCPLGKFEAAHRGEGPKWINDADRLQAAIELAALLPGDVTAIAGVGRSGIAPALLIAERLHCHAYAIDEGARLTTLPNGFRLGADPLGALAIVDDTIATGRSFGKLSANVARRHLDRP